MYSKSLEPFLRLIQNRVQITKKINCVSSNKGIFYELNVFQRRIPLRQMIIHKQPDLVFSFFLPLTFILNILQLNGKYKRWQVMNLFRYLFLLFMFVISIILVCFKCYWLYVDFKKYGMDLNFVFNVSSLIWNVESFESLCFIAYWQHFDKLQKLLNLLKSSCDRKRLEENKSLHLLSISLCLQSIAYTSFIAFAALGNLFYVSEFRICQLKYDGIFFGNKDLNIFIFISMVYNSFAWCLSAALYLIICRCILIEIAHLNKTNRFEENFGITSLKTFIKVHRQLANVVEEFSNTFNLYYFLTMLFQLPLITLLSFNLITATFNLYELIIVVSWVATGTLKIGALSLTPAEIFEQVKLLALKDNETMNSRLINIERARINKASAL